MACFVIAEAGVCHDGSLDKAKQLILAAKYAGADACKFQFFNSQKLWRDDRIKHLELRFRELVVLHQHSERAGIEFLCTPFGMEEVILLTPYVKRWKIASGCLTRRPILEAVRDTQKPVILSTGMSTQTEVGEAIEVLDLGQKECCELTLLHCTSAYPCPIEDVNLRAMETMLHYHRCPVGYSDHTLGITIPIAAAAMGAQVIEKHLTLDCNAEGPDHKASIEPKDFGVMVKAIRTVEVALGDGVKRVQPSEEPLRKAWREPATADC